MKISIIGGSGKLGQWITKLIISKGFTVSISTPNLGKYKDFIDKLKIDTYTDNRLCVKESDVVIISVPLHKNIEVINEVLPFMKKGSTLVEISSIKKDIVDLINIKKNNFLSKEIELLSIHPMFGPNAKTLKNQNIILIPNELSKESFKKAKDFLVKNGANIVISSFEEHDKKIAYTLSLAHFTILLFTSLIKEYPDLEELEMYGGSSFKILKLLSESLLNESWELYSHIQIDNSYFREILKSFKNKFNELSKIVEKYDYKKFEEFWKKYVLDKLSNSSSHKSHKKIYKILEKI